MSWYASAWAEKAPVGTVYERAILTYLAHRAKKDGTNCYPSTKTLAEFALCDKRTAQRHLDTMIERGLIAKGDQSVTQHLRADRRPTVYDILIPYDWYSNDQLEDVNEERAERDLSPLRPEDRPRLSPPPKSGREKRSDKGKKNPNRRRKISVTSENDDTETGCLSDVPSEPVDNSERGDSQTPRRGVSQTSPRGVSLPPETVPGGETPQGETPPPPVVPHETAHAGEPSQPSNEREGETSTGNNHDQAWEWKRAVRFLKATTKQVPDELVDAMTAEQKTALVHMVMDCRSYGLDDETIRAELVNTYGTKNLGSAWEAKLQRLIDQKFSKLKSGAYLPECSTCRAAAGEPTSFRVVLEDPLDPTSREVPCPACLGEGSLSSITDAPSAPSAAS